MTAAPHLAPFGDAWHVWRWVVLRGTGFPARRVLDLANAELAATADRTLELVAEVDERRVELTHACKAALQHGGVAEPSLRRAIKRLRQDRVPEPIDDPIVEAVRRSLAVAETAAEAQRTALAESYHAAQRTCSQVLRDVASDDRFRQAVLWQNREAINNTLDGLLRQPVDALDAEIRRKQRTVASYLQRYCVKNETIGFFGPVGWARFVDDALHAHQQAGRALLATRTVYYELWAIDALARKLAEDPALRPFLRPRRLPGFRVDGTVLHYPIERRSELSAELAAVAALCNGERTAREIASDPSVEPLAEDGVFELLDELVDAHVIRWTLEIPTAGPHPDRQLRALLASIDDAELHRSTIAPLDELDEHRATIARAGDAVELDRGLRSFDEVFTRVTGASVHRAHGQTYAGRTPLYEDCRRDVDMNVGRGWLDRAARALEPVLYSARWYTHEIAAGYRVRLGEIYDRLRAEGGPVVDYARFWQHVPALFPGGAAAGSIVGSVRDELRRRWTAILAIDPAERLVVRDPKAVAAAVREKFDAAGPGWPAARYQSPDVMIVARGPAALANGDYRIVLGELHAGINTVASPMFAKEHPRVDDIARARGEDLGHPCIAPVWSTAVSRGDYYSLVPHDVDLETGDTRSARPRSQVVSTGELVVEEVGGRLEVRTLDERWRFDIIAFLEHHLIAESFASFSIVTPAPWTPRVEIGDVVIARETWRLAPADFEWAAIKDPVGRFLTARRWARGYGMPRWMFVKTPEEVKPVYVDLDSPVYIELLAKQLRGAVSATLSEMLPSIEDTWLTDAAGATYTAELRIAAVDPVPWRAGQ